MSTDVDKSGRKVISVKDYLMRRDERVEYPVPGSDEIIAFRMRKPTVKDSQAIQEYVSMKFGTTSLPSSFEDASEEEKRLMLEWSYYY